ncbi:MAG: transcriptional repressor LexA [Bacteriovoracaceae bacterium]|nr:transcriptional repressor LexA [Bacteriovoracaceae bacterium]
MSLTRKQKEVLDFIVAYIDHEGISPTYSEIQEYFGLKSKGSVHDYVRYLKRAGFLEIDPNSHRGLTPTNPESKSTRTEVEIPLLGSVAAGCPLDVMDNMEHCENVSIPSHMIGRGKYFALQVEGQSMIEEGILDGDIIVVKAARSAHNGQTVVALVEGGATVKKYYQKNNKIELHPANHTMDPIVVTGGDFELQGLVVGLYRAYG